VDQMQSEALREEPAHLLMIRWQGPRCYGVQRPRKEAEVLRCHAKGHLAGDCPGPGKAIPVGAEEEGLVD